VVSKPINTDVKFVPSVERDQAKQARIDIDDTIKVTLTSDPTGIVETTFADEPTPVSGMPELYAQIKSHLPEDTPWFYLSASPYNLYPFLRQFREQYFPHGTLILRDFSWKTISGLLSALTVGTEEYKTDRMKKINSWLPQRKMVAIGDSTQSDPEAYGEM
jgi:phosphatidate phosphatase APP1